MSNKCPDKIKAAWAFRVYGNKWFFRVIHSLVFQAHVLFAIADYDDDGIVSEQDIGKVIDQLTSGTDPTRVLEFEEKQKIARVVRGELIEKK